MFTRHLYFALIALTLATGVGPRASGQDQGFLKADYSELANEGKWSLDGFFASESQQYSTPIENRSEFKSSNLLRLKLDVRRTGEQSQFQLDSQLVKSVNTNYQFISIDQAYAGSINPEKGFSLGRKIQFWSTADQDWNLGLWQPLYQEDGIRIHQQGLTGAFYKNKWGDFAFSALASPIFIPSLNGDLSQQGDRLTTQSRWMRDLPEQATVNGREVELTYRLKTPPYNELLSHPTFAIQGLWGSREQGLWAAVGLARKPMNTLSIKYDAALVSRSVGYQGQAEVVPVVHNHNLVSVDVGTELNGISLAASAMADQPLDQAITNRISDEGFQTDYYQQRPLASQVLALKASSELILQSLNQSIQWTLGYLRVYTQKTLDYDSEGAEQSQFVPYRYLFTNAASLQLQTTLKEKLNLSLKYLRDFDQTGSLWSIKASYGPIANWSFFGGVDLLGIDQVSSVETDNRFLNSFRHNDRVYGGLSYGF